MIHRDPEGVVLEDCTTGELRDFATPMKALLWEDGRFREISLRVARGVIRDLPCERLESEACD